MLFVYINGGNLSMEGREEEVGGRVGSGGIMCFFFFSSKGPNGLGKKKGGRDAWWPRVEREN